MNLISGSYDGGRLRALSSLSWKIALTVCSLILSPFTFVGMLRMPSGDF